MGRAICVCQLVAPCFSVVLCVSTMTKKDEVANAKQVRIRADLLDRIERYRALLSSKVGVEVSLTLLVSSLLEKGLSVAEGGK